MRIHQALQNLNPFFATHFPSLSRGYNIDLNTHMFIEDIQLSIMPIGGRTNRRVEFAAEFQGEVSECEKAKGLISQIGEFDKQNESEMVCGVIESILSNMLWNGKATFEIIKDSNQIFISSFTSKNLYKILCWYLQIIPYKDRDIWNRKFSLANQNKVWEVEIPKILGGAKGYKNVIKKLERYDDLGPKFYKQNLKRGVVSKEFDFLEYRRNSETYVNAATKNWGWNGRNWTQDRCTEFYTFYRMLNFKYAQAILREYIINKLNSLFSKLKINCKIIIKGLPTSKEILKIRKDLQHGELSFNEVSDKVEI